MQRCSCVTSSRPPDACKVFMPSINQHPPLSASGTYCQKVNIASLHMDQFQCRRHGRHVLLEDFQTSTFVQQQLWQTGRLFITSPTRSRRRINQLFLHHCSQHSQMQSGDIFVSENVIRSLVKGESGRHIGTSRNMGALAWECTIQQGSLCLIIGIWHRHISRISQYMRVS